MTDTWGVFDAEGMVAEFATESSAISAEISLVSRGHRGIYRGPVCLKHNDECSLNCKLCMDEEETDSIDITKHEGWDGDC